ncbi:hypothetical protein T07_1030 [Trichinella nelsoni]|uniref:Uncharacterized protein n=1 Tax=Trichinella nelsoni TaxID=6336 RepID=A0A0V0SGI1_9BILA|nr:hypothetical protein T07_1030 [Trichinella nelsoni]
MNVTILFTNQTDKQVACSIRIHDPLKRSRCEITRRITDLETFLTFLMMLSDCTDHSEDTETTTSNRWSESQKRNPNYSTFELCLM